MKRIFLITALIFIAIIAFSVPNYAQQTFTNVSNLDEFKKAIANSKSVILTDDIDVTDELKIPASYSGEIKSSSKTLSLAQGVDNMFVIESGANVTFNNIIFDGKEHGRIIDAGESTVTIKNSTLKNATTENFEQKIVDGKDTQRFEGGAIYVAHTTLDLQDTKFEDNYTKATVPSPGAPHGGAIVSYSANIKITGGSFINNYTGKVDKEFSSHGEGGAIKLHPGSTLTINSPEVTKKDTTIFEGNHLDGIEDKGGRQGGAIEATESKIHIYGATFKITGPFNTGGAIKFERCNDAIVKNSHFETVEGKGDIGIAGGAITSQDSNLSIDSSSFKANTGSRVLEAGGLIQVTDSGKFNLTNSTLEGAGAWFNGGKDGLFTANTGGAINFYDDSTVTAEIKDTTIKNFMVDGAGAGISLAKSAGHKATVTLTMTNTTIENTSAYVWQGTAHGGAMFVGGGNTVNIKGGKISSQTASNNAGGIFNEGTVIITGSDKGPAQITGNAAYQMVGGIYNDGHLKIDNANFSGNSKGDNSTGDGHVLNKDEMGGINIYADRDVIITPNATFDDKDIRVLDGQSKILLTGTLKNKINVSVSEKAKQQKDPKNILDRYSEKQERYIGYTVAAGTGYTPTEKDAQNLHYVTKDKSQAKSDFSDHTGVGAWDYVLDPVTKNVVLGQRAKMVFHANGTTTEPANFKDGDQKKETLYTIYSSKTPWTSPEQMQELKEEPTRDGFTFTGWYYSVNSTNENPAQDTNNDNSIQKITDPSTVAEHLLKFDEVKFTGKSETAGTNTSSNSNPAMMRSASIQTSDANGKGITSIVSPYIINTYAGWAQTIDIPVQKTWIDTEKEDKKAVTIRLFADGKEVKSLVLKANDDPKLNWKDKFKNLPVYQQNEDGSYESIKYTIKEDTLGTDYKEPDINPNLIDAVTQLEAQKNDKTGSEFTVKNQKIYKFDLTVTKNWEDDNNKEGLRPESVSITLTPSSGDPIKAVIDSKTNTYTFKNLQKKDAKNKEITYKLSEDEVTNYKTKEILQPTFDKNDSSKATASITNSREVEYITLSGEKVWDDANNQDGKRPTSITVNVKRGEDVVATKEVNGTGDTWSYKFEKLPKYINGKEAIYTVEEANAPDGYTVTIDGTKITNSYKPQVMNLNVEKIWHDANNQDGKRPDSITVSLIKNGQTTDKTIIIKDDGKGNWQGTFTNLPVFENGNEIKYTIKEEPIEGYSSSIENYKITNSYKPEKITISGHKTWDDEENKYGKRPDMIKVSLMKGNQVIQTVEVKSDENGEWNYSFDPVYKYEAGKLINYSVKEDPVEGYTAAYSETGYNINNTYRPEPTPEPEPKPTPDPEKQKQHVEKQVEPAKSPQTGDNGFAIYTLILAISLGGMLVTSFRKQNELEEK